MTIQLKEATTVHVLGLIGLTLTGLTLDLSLPNKQSIKLLCSLPVIIVIGQHDHSEAVVDILQPTLNQATTTERDRR